MNMMILFTGAGFFLTIGDLILAQWARTSHLPLLALGLFLNLIGISFYAQTLRLESVGLATAVFLGINIIAVCLGGYFFLDQSYTFREYFGLIMLGLAIVLIEL